MCLCITIFLTIFVQISFAMIENLYSEFLKSTGISTDTRSIEKGNIFFALKGPHFNANAFAEKALEKGAALAVIDDHAFAIPKKTILVEDVLTTLQRLAGYHRDQFDIPVLAITGSNGKTTTKELAYAVLSEKYRVTATRGNLNNHIGVPLTLLSIDKSTELAIIEMGANRLGEISMLCGIARPTHGLITNIGRAHTGLFGGFDGVVRAKSELYDHLLKNNGIVFINQRQDILMNMAKRFRDPILYPGRGGYYQCTFIDARPYVKLKTEEGRILSSNLIGAYNFDNIATALCLGKYFGVDPAKAQQAIESYIPQNNRSQIIKKDHVTIMLDAYNANPSSMQAALEAFSALPGRKKAVILGDMFELGDDSPAEHAQIGQLASKYDFVKKIFVGKDMQYAAENAGKSLYFEDKPSLITYLKETPFDEYTILIKGSRGMALEELVDYI